MASLNVGRISGPESRTMARKSKSERMESRARWQAIRAIRDAKVAFNMAHPDSELLAPNVTLVSRGRMDLGTALQGMKEKFSRCRVSQTIIKNDRVKVQKALQHKFRMNDADLYGDFNDESYKPGATIREKVTDVMLEASVRVGSRGKNKKTGI